MSLKPSVRLLVLTPSYPPQTNGVARVSVELTSRLRALGYEITVATPQIDGQPASRECDDVGVRRFRTRGRGILGSPYGGEIAAYHEFLRRSDADLLLFVAWEHWMVDTALPALPTLRAPKIVASHGTSVFWRPPGLRGFTRPILWLPHLARYQRSVASFDYIVLLTGRAERTRFYDRMLLDRPDLRTQWTIIPNGADCTRFGSAPGSFRRAHGVGRRLLVLSVGNFQAAKNQLGLLRAYERANLQDAILVLIASEMNEYGRRVETAVRSSHREDVRILTGQSDASIAAAYDDADLFVSGSLTEAQPLTILDAMASGTPFVSFDVGAVGDLPGGTVVGTEDAFVAQMRTLASDPERRRELADVGRRACTETYNWKHTALAYHALFQRILSERRVHRNLANPLAQ